MLKRFILNILLLLPVMLQAQTTIDSVSEPEISRILAHLSSDSLLGRGNFTREQLETAEWLGDEMANAGLLTFPGGRGFFHPFNPPFTGTRAESNIIWNGHRLPDSSYLHFGNHLISPPASLNEYTVMQVQLPLADSLLFYNWHNKEKVLLWIQTDGEFNSLISKLQLPDGLPQSDILLVASPTAPETMQFSGTEKSVKSVLYNVIGILPGKTRPEELVIFSAHYDHMGSFMKNKKPEVFNGANDNASGSTAVLALARYYGMRRDNDRTLVFCLFSGEELGLFGSTAFASTLLPDHVVANINLEMLGYTNLSGKNAFYVTGSWYSDLTRILKQNLKRSSIKAIASSADVMQEFERSDNYPFALLGIPAHTLTCSDDNDPCYHKLCDDFKRMDIPNLTRVVKGIIQACKGLVNGMDTPSRIRL